MTLGVRPPVGALAPAMYQSGPKDTVSTKDVYTEVSTASSSPVVAKPTVNSVAEPTPEKVSTSVSMLRSGKAILKETKSVLENVKIAKNYSTAKDAKERLSVVDGLSSNLLRGMEPGTFKDIMSNISNVSKMAVTVNGVKTSLKKGNITKLQGASRLLNGVSSNPLLSSVSDRGAALGALTGAVASSSKLGVPNTFGALKDNVTAIDGMYPVIQKSLPTIIGCSDIPSLKEMAQSTAKGTIKLFSPNAVSEVSANFKAPADTKMAISGPALHADLKATNALIDPNWNVTPRIGGNDAVDGTMMQEASPDYCSAFTQGGLRSTDPADKQLLVAQVFPKTDVGTQLQNSFPLTAVTTEPKQETAVSADPTVKKEEPKAYTYSEPTASAPIVTISTMLRPAEGVTATIRRSEVRWSNDEIDVTTETLLPPSPPPLDNATKITNQYGTLILRLRTIRGSSTSALYGSAEKPITALL